MKIAFVHNAYTSYRIHFFNELSKYYDVDYFFHKKYGSTKLKPIFKYKILLGAKIPFLMSDYTYAPFLFLHLLRRKYHIFIGAGSVYIDTLITFIISKLLRKPFILWDVTWFMPKTFLTIFRYPIVRYIIKYSDAIVLPGSKSKEYHLMIGATNGNIFISPNVIFLTITNIAQKKVKNYQNELQIQLNEIIVLFFGKIIRIKGIEYLIKAFSKLPDNINSRLIIASSLPGEVNYEKELKNICTKQGLTNVNFLKIITENDKVALFLLSDIFVLPSIVTKEGIAETWGMVLNEAMSVGKPVIATDAVGGAYDLIINNVNGYIVSYKNVLLLNKALDKIISDPYMKNMMGLKSKKIIEEKFSLKNAVDGFSKAINTVIRKYYILK